MADPKLDEVINKNIGLRKGNDVELVIDPSFVNHRKIQTLLGDEGMKMINTEIAHIPPNTPEWQKSVSINHIYTKILLLFCDVNKIKTMTEVVSNHSGFLMCSIETLLPCPEIYDRERVVSEIELENQHNQKIELHYSTNKIVADTGKSKLYDGDEFAIIAEFYRMTEDKVILHPLLMGLPYLLAKNSRTLLWRSYTDFYQVYIGDFEEFKKVKEIPLPKDNSPMKKIREIVFKKCLEKVLGDNAEKDWGGETSDYYSSHLHLGKNRHSAAFLLKGAARFRPMSLKYHTGKNNDQIIRLSKEPVDILIIQHCHDISLEVKEMLKVFATQPSNPRRYCLIDGRDSLRFLQAYNLLDWALDESEKIRKAEKAKK